MTLVLLTYINKWRYSPLQVLLGEYGGLDKWLSHRVFIPTSGVRVSYPLLIGVWCNGNTRDFGPLIFSSNLGIPTMMAL